MCLFLTNLKGKKEEAFLITFARRAWSPPTPL